MVLIMSNVSSHKSPISHLLYTLWPIERHENGKVLPMCAMMFCMLFNYSLLRSVKDGFVVTNIGAEAISFLKVGIVLPAAIIAMLVYSKLCGFMSQQKIFYAVTGFFTAFLLIFVQFLYPNVDLLHPSKETVERWLENSHYSLHWFIKIAGGWVYALFYTMSELWGSMMVSLLFWQFANQITKSDEAKRFYSTFGIIGNVGLLLTAKVLGMSASEDDKGAGGLGLSFAIYAAIVSAVVIMAVYWYINTYVLTNIKYYDPSSRQTSKKAKAKLSLGESMRLIFSSKYLGLIAILVMAYGISMNLIEGMWKAKIKEAYPTSESYSAFMGDFQMYQGIGAIIFMIVGSNVLRRVSWGVAAMFTPVMLLVTGLGFVSFIFFGDTIGAYISAIFFSNPLMMAINIGMLQNVLSKSTKYSLFDATKEMAYIPLDTDLKTKGKAAVDVVGGRLGKSGGGIIQSAFFALIPGATFADMTPYFASFFVVIVVLWIFAVQVLHREYNSQVADHNL